MYLNRIEPTCFSHRITMLPSLLDPFPKASAADSKAGFMASDFMQVSFRGSCSGSNSDDPEVTTVPGAAGLVNMMADARLTEAANPAFDVSVFDRPVSFGEP